MSKIEWTGETWNPVVGCSVISPGCTNCYAMTMAGRIERMDGRQAMPHYAGLTQPSKAGDVWTGKVALAPDAIMTKPLTWRKPRTIFVCSMADPFHEDVPDAWIDRVFGTMARAHWHTYQVLTKRSARLRRYLSSFREDGQGFLTRGGVDAYKPGVVSFNPKNWPLPNVWLGVSAEDQKRADERIPDLLATPAAVRFVSAEPLLGPIRFDHIGGTACLASPESCCKGTTYVDSLRGIQACERAGAFAYPGKTGMPRGLDWIIVGGESGPNARPMHPDWARSIRDQCASAGTAFFFKQWGAWLPSNDDVNFSDGAEWAARHFPGRPVQQISSGHTLVHVGKARAGRLLDCRTHDAMPATHREKEPA